MLVQLFHPSWWFAFLGDVWRWHLATVLLGWLVFPFLFTAFRRLPDRGYAVARILGAFFLSYVNWLLCHGILKFSPASLAVSIGLLALLWLIALREGRAMRAFFRRRWTWILTTELLALVLFLLLINIRSFCSDINYRSAYHGSEKLGNMMIFSSMWRTEHFPVEDSWHSIAPGQVEGEIEQPWLNYYYGGHLQWATLARLTGYSPEIAFNLALATLFSWIGIGAYSLVLNVTRRRRVAIIAAFVLVFAGNLEPLEQIPDMARGYSQMLQAAQAAQPEADPGGFTWSGFMSTSRYDFWRASRVICRGQKTAGGHQGLTVNEFPYFSFILGDLHAHSSALPLTLVVMHVLLALMISKHETGETWGAMAPHAPYRILLLCLLCGGLYFYNSWDAIPLAMLLAVFFFWDSSDWRHSPLLGPAGSAILLIAVLGLGIQVFFGPFAHQMKSPLIQGATAGARLDSFAGLFQISPWDLPTKVKELALFWGLIWLPIALTLFPSLWKTIRRIGFNQKLGLLVSFAAFVASLLAMTYGGAAVAICVFMAAVSGALAWRGKGSDAERFAARLAFAGFVIIAAAEMFYVQDGMPAQFRRYNTVFKLYYPAWTALTLSATILTWLQWRRLGAAGKILRREALRATVIVLLALGFVYPYFSTWARTDGFHSAYGDPLLQAVAARPVKSMRERTLDGLAYLSSYASGDLAAIRWLLDLDHIQGRPHMLEAEGDSYCGTGRVAAYTGLPTVIGWINHEAQWRGWPMHEALTSRAEDVRTIYDSPDIERATALLLKYGIDYVFVGDNERERYDPEGIAKFPWIGEEVFRSGETVIYRLDLPGMGGVL